MTFSLYLMQSVMSVYSVSGGSARSFNEWLLSSRHLLPLFISSTLGVIHLTISTRLTRNIKFSWLSLIFDCLVAELIYHRIQMSAQTDLRDGTGLCG